MTPLATRKAALAAAAASVLGSVAYFGAAGLASHRLRDFAGLVSALAGAAAFALLYRLARKRSLRLSPTLRSGIETGLGALVFLFVLYHLSHTLPFAGPVALAIDTLVPAPALHLLAILPGLIAAALTELVWRRPIVRPGPDSKGKTHGPV